MSDTIFALATAPGRAAVAVLRLSGPGVRKAVAALSGEAPDRRGMRLVTVRRPDDGVVLDRALVLFFAGPASYTGEDVAELHLHGGAAVVGAVSDALLGLGVRPARAGEFTRRAFENGKLDLSQAEAVADLIDAQSEAQHRQALAQLGGALAERHLAWRAKLVDALALLEANVDFPDEELPEELAALAAPPLLALEVELAEALRLAARGERVRSGYHIALIGAPNAGKSSLFNHLAGRDAAIVTPTPGTTRDVIEASRTIEGYQVIFSDTAGVRDATDDIEAEGVRRAQSTATGADLRLWLVDGSASNGDWRFAGSLVQPGDLIIISKADLPDGTDVNAVTGAYPQACRLSLADGPGLTELDAAIRNKVVEELGGAEFPAVTQARHRLLLEDALDHVRRGLAALTSGSELAAEDVRLAARALERVTGRIGAEDVLDRVFAQFCIGK